MRTRITARGTGRAIKLGGAAVLVLGLSAAGALPRSLEAIGQRGSLAVCAHPNALPYSSKRGPLPGFQIGGIPVIVVHPLWDTYRPHGLLAEARASTAAGPVKHVDTFNLLRRESWSYQSLA